MISNLAAMFDKADSIDIHEGMVAYQRYHDVMADIADTYRYSLERVVAVFVALSPNSDYKGNLRSTVSVLHGLNLGIEHHNIVVSTYNHCKLRAINYATDKHLFLGQVKGPKITNFYHNILNPSDTRWVTIDGHMSAIWQGRDLTMKEAIIRRSMYNRIAHDVKTFAFKNFILPNQMQAILWFTRKRTAKVRYNPQGSLFAEHGDLWGTIQKARDIVPYRFRE
jgi:hypothetical protein